MKTLSDLKTFIKQQARLDSSNYAGYVDAYKSDRNRIKQAQRACKKAAGFYWYHDKVALIPDEYFDGRLIITENSIDYTPGQYAPTEVYWALEDYLTKFRREEV